MVVHIFNRVCAQVLKAALFIVPLDLKGEVLLPEHSFGIMEDESLRRSSLVIEESEETIKEVCNVQDAVSKPALYRGIGSQTSTRRSIHGFNLLHRAQCYATPGRRVVKKKRNSAQRWSSRKDASRAVAWRKPVIVTQ
eukprot:GEMP01081908.1.p1 GENE.GEMP01081908.1~~GEMP01081908.1.p1  ORF type:complete len:138 (+),score=32.55 GEMP01081908.1:159-572(+)